MAKDDKAPEDVPATEADGGTPADQTGESGVIEGTSYKDAPDKPGPTSIAQVQEVPERVNE